MLIANRFRLVEKLAHGTFAEVWKALDTKREQIVALKILRPSARGDAARPWEPVFREVAASTRLAPHPHVLAPWALMYADFFSEMKTPCLAMEFIDGWNLAQWLLQVPAPAPNTIECRLTVMGGVLKGLAHAHACGVVHGDISFGNVMIRRPDIGLLTDFGSAHVSGVNTDPPTKSLTGGGNLQPINPPPYDGTVGGAEGLRRDVYAFATICYLALVGRHPLSDKWQTMRTGLWSGAPSPHETLARRSLTSLAPWTADEPHLRALSDLLLRCLSPENLDRPPTAGVVLHDWVAIME